MATSSTGSRSPSSRSLGSWDLCDPPERPPLPPPDAPVRDIVFFPSLSAVGGVRCEASLVPPGSWTLATAAAKLGMAFKASRAVASAYVRAIGGEGLLLFWALFAPLLLPGAAAPCGALLLPGAARCGALLLPGAARFFWPPPHLHI